MISQLSWAPANLPAVDELPKKKPLRFLEFRYKECANKMSHWWQEWKFKNIQKYHWGGNEQVKVILSISFQF